jgi:hypothetical protein
LANLTVPEAIAGHSGLTSNAKLAFAELFSRLKKGERPEVGLNDIGMQITLGGDCLLDAVRNLHEKGYAFLDEEIDSLEDLIPGQKVRLSPRIHIEVMPYVPADEGDVALRRFGGLGDKPFWDEVKKGRVLFRATVSGWMGEFSLDVDRRTFPQDAASPLDYEEFTLVQNKPFPTLKAAWDWFDELMQDPPMGEEEPEDQK